MTKSLVSALVGIAVMIGGMFLVLKKGPLGAGIIMVGLCVLLFGVSALSGIFYRGKKVQGRDRHP